MKDYVYNDVNHASRYLLESIIRIVDRKGTPRAASIRNVYPGDDIDDIRIEYISPTLSGNRADIGLYDKRVDLDPVPLGWVNVNTQNGTNKYDSNAVIFTSRIPSRSWHTGLTRVNLHHKHYSDFCKQYAPGNVMHTVDLCHTIEGRFFDIRELPVFMKHKRYEFAFSRQFAIINGKLFKGGIDEAVGSIDKDGSVKLNPEYGYLSGKVADLGVKCELSIPSI